MRKLETPRLVLRGFAKSDLNDYYEMLSNSNVSIPNGTKPLKDIDEARKQITHMAKSKNNYAILLKEENKVIGCIGLNEDALRNINARNLGFVLNEKYWNKGYMSEALEVVIENAHEYAERLSMVVKVENKKSERIARKFGFEYYTIIENIKRQVDLVPHDDTYYILDLRTYIDR